MLCNESWEIVPCATVVKSTLAIPHRVPQTAEGEEEKKRKKKILHNAVWIGPEGHPTQACGN